MRKPKTGEVEQRLAPQDGAELTVEGKHLHGVIPYGVESRDLGGWREVIERGALSSAQMDDLVATLNHDVSRLLGRHPGTLEVEDRDDGLHWSVELPESPTGEDVRVAVQRGDLRAGSWRMVVGRDRWDGNVRHVEEVRELRDVAVVTTPAYPAAAAELRSHEREEVRETTNEEDAVRREKKDGGALTVEDRANTQEQGTAEARLLEAMRGIPRGEARDLTHATTTPVQPDDVRTVLSDRFRERSVFVQAGATVMTTDKKAVRWPTLVGDVTADFYDEQDVIVPSDPDLDEFSIPVKAIKALVRASNESLEDSDPALTQIVVDSINNAMVDLGDANLIAGNHAKGFKGITQLTSAQHLAVDGALSWDDIVKATGMLIERNVPGPYAVLMGPRPATALALTKEATGSNQYLGRPDGIPPIFNTGRLPLSADADPGKTTTVVVYAPAQCTVVIRRDAMIEIDRSKLFDSDESLVRGRYRLGLGVEKEESVVLLTGVAAPPIDTL